MIRPNCTKCQAPGYIAHPDWEDGPWLCSECGRKCDEVVPDESPRLRLYSMFEIRRALTAHGFTERQIDAVVTSLRTFDPTSAEGKKWIG